MSRVLYHVSMSFEECTDEIVKQGMVKFGTVFKVRKNDGKFVLFVPKTKLFAPIHVYCTTATADQTLDGVEKTVWTMRVFDMDIEKAMGVPCCVRWCSIQ